MNNLIKTKKSLGQHFLSANWVLSYILNSAEIDDTDTIIEIGPGRGKLTRELSTIANKVKCIELDDRLISSLEEDFPVETNVDIIHGDARIVDIGDIVGLIPYKLVANLPYYAAMPIIMRFVELSTPPSLIVVMVQDEVARNLSALPGKLSIPAVILQNFGKVSYIKKIPPSAFKPAPKIFSAIIKITLFDKPKISSKNQHGFFDLIKKGFGSKRKKLYNNISVAFDISKMEVKEILLLNNINIDLRPQSLTITNWIDLFLTMKNHGYISNV